MKIQNKTTKKLLWRKLPMSEFVHGFAAGFVVMVVVLMGVTALTGSYATTPKIASETEAGLRSGSATLLTDSAASGGQAVKFGASAVTYSASNTVPVSLSAGQAGSFGAHYSASTTTTGVILNAEIYNSSGVRVSQHFQESQTIGTNPVTLNWTWTPSTTGTYIMKLGIFTAGWASTLHWNENAAAFSVGGGSSSASPWGNNNLYVDPYNQAIQYYHSNPGMSDGHIIKRMGQTAVGMWLGGWNTDVQRDVNNYVTGAVNANAVPVLIPYYIPQRDCGHYSAGGAPSKTEYLNWIQKVAAGIGPRTVVVVLEPDALPAMDCLSSADQAERTDAIYKAIGYLKANPKTYVYVDAGHTYWKSADVMAQRLNAVGISRAEGFSLNISNFIATADNVTYGKSLSSKINGKRFVVDTARNGNGPSPDAEWCNPPGRAVGKDPTTATGHAEVDAYLWLKSPWASDGPCNGGPNAGDPYWEYAIKLGKNAGW